MLVRVYNFKLSLKIVFIILSSHDIELIHLQQCRSTLIFAMTQIKIKKSNCSPEFKRYETQYFYKKGAYQD